MVNEMVTLITVYHGKECVGRCDEKCYDAKEPKCDCVCGGMNHGRGQEEAIENTQNHSKNIMKTWQKKHIEKTAKTELRALRWEVAPMQLGLSLDEKEARNEG